MGPLRRLRRFPYGIDRQLWASCVMGPCVGCVSFLVEPTAVYSIFVAIVAQVRRVLH